MQLLNSLRVCSFITWYISTGGIVDNERNNNALNTETIQELWKIHANLQNQLSQQLKNTASKEDLSQESPQLNPLQLVQDEIIHKFEIAEPYLENDANKNTIMDNNQQKDAAVDTAAYLSIGHSFNKKSVIIDSLTNVYSLPIDTSDSVVQADDSSTYIAEASVNDVTETSADHNYIQAVPHLARNSYSDDNAYIDSDKGELSHHFDLSRVVALFLQLTTSLLALIALLAYLFQQRKPTATAAYRDLRMYVAQDELRHKMSSMRAEIVYQKE